MTEPDQPSGAPCPGCQGEMDSPPGRPYLPGIPCRRCLERSLSGYRPYPKFLCSRGGWVVCREARRKRFALRVSVLVAGTLLRVN